MGAPRQHSEQRGHKEQPPFALPLGIPSAAGSVSSAPRALAAESERAEDWIPVFETSAYRGLGDEVKEHSGKRGHTYQSDTELYAIKYEEHKLCFQTGADGWPRPGHVKITAWR